MNRQCISVSALVRNDEVKQSVRRMTSSIAAELLSSFILRDRLLLLLRLLEVNGMKNAALMNIRVCFGRFP